MIRFYFFLDCVQYQDQGQAIQSCDDIHLNKLLDEIDTLGAMSALAQELKTAITSREKLINSGHTLVVYINDSNFESEQKIIGYLKYGVKPNLYFYGTVEGKKGVQLIQRESTYCLLDFYVLETAQRRGIGKQMFDAFISKEEIDPAKVAYDRPSSKLLPFLQRHYGLVGADLQPNRYAIFPKYFFLN